MTNHTYATTISNLLQQVSSASFNRRAQSPIPNPHFQNTIHPSKI
jgi:hypothetical protein